jgi:hypothetical protein
MLTCKCLYGFLVVAWNLQMGQICTAFSRESRGIPEYDEQYYHYHASLAASLIIMIITNNIIAETSPAAFFNVFYYLSIHD